MKKVKSKMKVVKSCRNKRGCAYTSHESMLGKTFEKKAA